MIPLAALGILKSFDVKMWAIIGLSAAILGLSGTVTFKNYRISGLKNEVKAQELKAQEHKQIADSFRDSLAKQNLAIDDLASKNGVYKEMLEKAGIRNNQLAEQAKVIIRRIEQTPVPNTCVGAMKHLEGFTYDYAEEWNAK